MSAPTHRLCPECRTEYLLTAERCADCDVALVHPDDVPEEAPPEELPPASELTGVRVAPLAWMRALSGALQERGVAHRIEPARPGDAPEGQRPDVFGNVQLFGLYVPEEAAAEAREIDGSIAAQLLPEEAPALAGDEQEACPACGTALSADAVECPECGLAFG